MANILSQRTRENRRRHERIAEISHKEHNKVSAILQLLKNEKFALFNSCVSSTTWGVELEVGGSGKNYFFLAFHKSADNMFLSPSTPRKYHIVGVQFKLFLFALLFRHCMEFFCGVAAHFAEISSFFISSTHVSSRVRRVWNSGGKNSRELFPFSMNVRRSSAMIVNQFSFCFAQLNCIQLNLVELELLVRSSGPREPSLMENRDIPRWLTFQIQLFIFDFDFNLFCVSRTEPSCLISIEINHFFLCCS